MTNFTVMPFGYVFSFAAPTNSPSAAGDNIGIGLSSGDSITVLPNAFLVETGTNPPGFGASLVMNGSSRVTNSGILSSNGFYGVVAYDGTGTGGFLPTITNAATGLISGGTAGVLVGNTAGSITSIANSGQITGSNIFGTGIQVTSGSAEIANTGTITGGTFGYSIFASTTDAIKITNSGTLVGNVVAQTTSGLTLDNTGGLIQGDVAAGAAADTIDNNGGKITGLVNLREGADTFTGGDGVDKVLGGNGDDLIDLNGGNDIYYASNSSLIGGASDGNDDVDGGAGIDTYVAFVMGAPNVVTIDLTNGIATGVEFGVDQILNFENVVGSGVSDVITGNAGRNVINGGAGSDSINGAAGNDRIVGGLGADTIFGSAGQDVMTGGATNSGGDGFRDTFVFSALSDSGAAGTPRDWITDFTRGPAATADRINLAAIDANTTLAGNQAFIWQAAAGAAFTGVKGQLHYAVIGGNTYISGDVNGDKVADFSIGLTGSQALSAIDFIL